jgi:hypothetical protein
MEICGEGEDGVVGNMNRFGKEKEISIFMLIFNTIF